MRGRHRHHMGICMAPPCGGERPGSLGPCFCPQGTPENPGINQRALQLLFSEVQEKASDWDYTITVSAAEIYNEVLRWAVLARGTARPVALWSAGPCRAVCDECWSRGYMSGSAQGSGGPRPPPHTGGGREKALLSVPPGPLDQTQVLLFLPSLPSLPAGCTRW